MKTACHNLQQHSPPTECKHIICPQLHLPPGGERADQRNVLGSCYHVTPLLLIPAEADEPNIEAMTQHLLPHRLRARHLHRDITAGAGITNCDVLALRDILTYLCCNSTTL